MMLRRLLSWVPVAAVAACAWTGCKDSGNSETTQASADLVARCEQLARACGDADKHVQDIIAECNQAAEKQIANGCSAEAIAAYDCYEEKLCGKGDKIWALDDLRVLSERHGTCTAQHDALRECAGNEGTSNGR